MTQEQKKQIIEMRKQNLGYAYIAKELDISLNTVKAFCRRNDLAGNRSTTDTQPENISESSPKNDLLSDENRANTTACKRPRGLENTEFSDGQPVCEITVSYADEPDQGAVADVLDMLTHAHYGEVTK